MGSRPEWNILSQSYQKRSIKSVHTQERMFFFSPLGLDKEDRQQVPSGLHHHGQKLAPDKMDFKSQEPQL